MTMAQDGGKVVSLMHFLTASQALTTDFVATHK